MKFILSLATLSLVIAPVAILPSCPIGTPGCASSGTSNNNGGIGGFRNAALIQPVQEPIQRVQLTAQTN